MKKTKRMMAFLLCSVMLITSSVFATKMEDTDSVQAKVEALGLTDVEVIDLGNGTSIIIGTPTEDYIRPYAQNDTIEGSTDTSKDLIYNCKPVDGNFARWEITNISEGNDMSMGYSIAVPGEPVATSNPITLEPDDSRVITAVNNSGAGLETTLTITVAPRYLGRVDYSCAYSQYWN